MYVHICLQRGFPFESWPLFTKAGGPEGIWETWERKNCGKELLSRGRVGSSLRTKETEEGPVGSSLEFGKDRLGRFFQLQNPKKSR